jgi:sterol desaturase/sphingolipid hydroxylase (fatty acid hydroxylase superfamily)
MYFDIRQNGWAYFFLSVLLGVVGYDIWFYWQHRLLHTPGFFERFHAVHHRAHNPTSFANFTHTWVEILMGNVYFVLFAVFVPQHPLAVTLTSMFIFGWGMVGHMGYEFFPRAFARTRAFGWVNTSTHHNMHHSQLDCNYGMFFNFWDRVMGTNHPRYRETFESVPRSSGSRALAAAADSTVLGAHPT